MIFNSSVYQIFKFSAITKKKTRLLDKQKGNQYEVLLLVTIIVI